MKLMSLSVLLTLIATNASSKKVLLQPSSPSLLQRNAIDNETIPYDAVHKTLTIPLQFDSSVLFTVGTPFTNVKLMPAFHTHRTFITSVNCLKCKSRAFDTTTSSTDIPGVESDFPHLEYLFDHYGTG